MKRPLAFALVFLAAGILTGFYNVAAAPAAFMATGVAATICLYFRRKSAVVFIGFYLAGLAAVGACAGVDADMLAHVGKPSDIRGIVVDEAATRNGYRLTVKTAQGVKIIAQTMNEAPVGVGGAVAFEAVPETLARPADPGAFDEFLYMRARGVHFKTFCREITPAPTASPLYALRNRLSAVYDRLLPQRESGLIRAMILGDKTGLDAYIRSLYRVAGVYHLLAISGLHLSVLALSINFALGWVVGRRYAGLVTIVFLAAYSVFTGMSPSVVRAAIMCTVIIFGDLLLREKDPLSSAAFAAILILLRQPLYLFDVGFQYSFAAVFGIVTLAKPVANRIRLQMPASFAPLANPFAVTLSATVATTPIAAWHFFHVMPFGLLANLIITPPAALVVVAGFLTGLLGLAMPTLAAPLAGGLTAVFRVYELVCEGFALLPGVDILTGRWPVLLVLLWYGTAAFAGVVLHIRRYAETLALWAACCVALVFAHTLQPPPWHIHRMADSGCDVVTQGHEAIVFDGGVDVWRLQNYLDYCGIRDVTYFGLSGNDGTQNALANVRAVFAAADLPPGSVLRKGAAEVYVTEGHGIILRADGEEHRIR